MNTVPARFTALLAFLVCPIVFLGCGPDSTDSTSASVSSDSVAALVAEILAREDRIARTAGIATLLQDLPESHLPEVLEGFDGAFLEWGDNEPVLLAEWWTRFDPLAAKEWSETDWVANHPRVGLTVMRGMARTDPELALETYFSTNLELSPRVSDYPDALEAIVIGWYESGKPGLLDFVKSQPSSELRQQTLGTLARLVVLSRGSDGAIEWADARIAEDPTPIFVRQIQQRIAGALAQHDPASATAWVEGLIEQGAHGSLPRRVARHWVKQDPAAALLWLENFQDNEFNKAAVRQTWNVWAGLDPIRAHAWVREQGDKTYGFLGPALARSIRKMATMEQRTKVPSDYIGHLTESIRIEDPETRWGSVTFVARFWRLEDEAAAEAWMEENDVPQSYRVKVRGPLPGGLSGLVREEALSHIEDPNND